MTIQQRISINVFVAAVISVHAFLLGFAVFRDSPVNDEPGHLVAGLSHWKFCRFDLYCVNPPLVRMVGTLPVQFCRPKTDWDDWDTRPWERSEFLLGRRFLKENGSASLQYFRLARCACIPFSLLGAYICFRWSQQLYGDAAGILALALWCFSPNILAHGHLITPDVGATAMGVAAMYVFWHWLREPSWMRAFFAGLCLGLVQLTKLTWILLFVLWPILWIVWWLGGRTEQTRGSRQLAQLLLMFVLALYVINTGYGFEGSLRRVGDFKFVSRILAGPESSKLHMPTNRFSGTLMSGLRVPLPSNYVSGIDVQKRGFENNPPAYLRGELRRGGWWYYYLYALAVKVPCGTLFLMVAATVLTATVVSLVNCRDRTGWRNEAVLLAPVLVVLVFVSYQTSVNKHLRYVLPILPFAFIWISKIAGIIDWHRRKTISSGILLMATWSASGSLWVYPHTLSYFNEFVVGPHNGSHHLLGSNVSWGQDVLFLKRWVDAHPDAGSIYIALSCAYDPRTIGLKTQPPGRRRLQIVVSEHGKVKSVKPVPGYYAIDVNVLRGYSASAISSTGPLDCAYFRRLRPVAQAGYSIYIFRIPSDDVSRRPS